MEEGREGIEEVGGRWRRPTDISVYSTFKTDVWEHSLVKECLTSL